VSIADNGKVKTDALRACFNSSFLKPAKGASIKRRVEPEAATLGQVWIAIKPVKRAADSRLAPTSWALCPLLPFAWGSRPRLYAFACFAGSNLGF
jgi:hypothetical protein